MLLFSRFAGFSQSDVDFLPTLYSRKTCGTLRALQLDFEICSSCNRTLSLRSNVHFGTRSRFLGSCTMLRFPQRMFSSQKVQSACWFLSSHGSILFVMHDPMTFIENLYISCIWPTTKHETQRMFPKRKPHQSSQYDISYFLPRVAFAKVC